MITTIIAALAIAGSFAQDEDGNKTMQQIISDLKNPATNESAFEYAAEHWNLWSDKDLKELERSCAKAAGDLSAKIAEEKSNIKKWTAAFDTFAESISKRIKGDTGITRVCNYNAEMLFNKKVRFYEVNPQDSYALTIDGKHELIKNADVFKNICKKAGVKVKQAEDAESLAKLFFVLPTKDKTAYSSNVNGIGACGSCETKETKTGWDVELGIPNVNGKGKIIFSTLTIKADKEGDLNSITIKSKFDGMHGNGIFQKRIPIDKNDEEQNEE